MLGRLLKEMRYLFSVSLFNGFFSVRILQKLHNRNNPLIATTIAAIKKKKET